jgi:hypothetical protein
MTLKFIYQEGNEGLAVPTLVWTDGLPPTEEDIVAARENVVMVHDVMPERLDLSRWGNLIYHNMEVVV